MASTFTRPDSKFIQVRFKDENGRWKSKATQYRKDNLGDVRQAKLMARQMSTDERLRGSTEAEASEHFVNWVDAWMVDRYGGKAQVRTLKIYRVHWEKLLPWLRAAGVHSPGQMSFRVAMEYRAARLREGASNNLTIAELKFLSSVMNRAVQLGYAQGNPLLRMGLKKDEREPKNPWSDEEIAMVAKATESAPQWMRVTFLLGLYQAARMRQCAVPLGDINLEQGRISYWRTVDGRPLVKGNKPFTQPIDPRLLPELGRIVNERKAAGFKSLCDIPEFPSLEWRRFLDGLGLRHLVHHGLRVTWITRAATSAKDGQRGIFLSEAKRFVNHGSTAVHEIYQRLNADDISHVPSAMRLPEL